MRIENLFSELEKKKNEACDKQVHYDVYVTSIPVKTKEFEYKEKIVN